jgi:type II secretory pathway pseudopilin PulG
MWSTNLSTNQQKTGFTVIEVLLSLALTGMLMTAVAVALHASLTSYHENDKIATATQTARSVLNRMMRDVRTAEAVNCDGYGAMSIIPPENGDGLEMIQYESVYDGKLYYRRTVNGNTTQYVLIGDSDEVTVSNFTAYNEMAQDGEGVWYTKCVTARLEVLVDDKRFTVTASAAPRRNQEY